jgi:hypothetical protein
MTHHNIRILRSMCMLKSHPKRENPNKAENIKINCGLVLHSKFIINEKIVKIALENEYFAI